MTVSLIETSPEPVRPFDFRKLLTVRETSAIETVYRQTGELEAIEM
ncbi:hypothetical protein AB0I30_12360 [Nocardia tengchongensis]